MERLSLQKESDYASRERLSKIERELADLKEDQSGLNAQWQAEKAVLDQRKTLKEEIDRVNVEIQQAEREYDLNRAAELKFGTLNQLQQQLDAIETQLQQPKIVNPSCGKKLPRQTLPKSFLNGQASPSANWWNQRKKNSYFWKMNSTNG
jgi:ATP-dependent Clp protease ATP-binding subunit ClpB